jgi:hypothetical protein
MYKKIFFLFLMIITLFSITSCSKVEDTNGLDNYSIETFSDD